MKKKIFALLLSVFLPICVMLSACSLKSYDVYYSDVPLDITYSATLTNYLEVQNSAHPDFKESTTTLFAVSQKYEIVAGQQRFVTYVEWRQIGHWYNNESDISYTFLHIGDKTFILNEDGNAWIGEENGSMFYTYSSIYSNITDSSSFRHMMTSKLWLRTGNSLRELPKRYKTKTTDEYIEYVCKDDETFRISNDKYNVVLKYDYDTHLGSREIQNATFNPDSTSVPHLTNDGTTNGVPTGNIPHLNTITAEMLEA